MVIWMADHLPRYKKSIFALPKEWGEKMNFVVFGTKWHCQEIDIVISAVLTAIARKGRWVGVSTEEVSLVLKDNSNRLVPYDSDWASTYLLEISATRDVVLIRYHDITYIYPTRVLKQTLIQSRAVGLMGGEDGQG